MAINLLGLNPEQYAAVIAPANSTSTLVLAGAGTGKTTVLTYRAAHLIQDRDIKPSAVLAVTFTNKGPLNCVRAWLPVTCLDQRRATKCGLVLSIHYVEKCWLSVVWKLGLYLVVLV